MIKQKNIISTGEIQNTLDLGKEVTKYVLFLFYVFPASSLSTIQFLDKVFFESITFWEPKRQLLLRKLVYVKGTCFL